jgi:hypothetical protein
MVCSEDVFRSRLGVLGVPLITIPDSSPPSLEGSIDTRLEALLDFLQGDRPFSVVFGSDGCARAHPSGVAPEASEEWFDSSEVLILFAMPRSAVLFPHAAWP